MVFVEVNGGGVVAVASEDPDGVFALAGDGAVGSSGGVAEESAIFVHEGELDVGEGVAGFVGEGVGEDFLVVIFDEESDVGEFDDGAGDEGAFRGAVLWGGGEFEEDWGGRGFAEDIAPFEVMEGGFLDGFLVGESVVVNEGAWEFFEGILFDGFGGFFWFLIGVVGFSEEVASLDELALGEFFDA